MAGTQYADAKYGVDHLLYWGEFAAAGSCVALEEIARFNLLTDIKLKEVRAEQTVQAAGATSGFNIMRDAGSAGTATTSLGQVLFGTATIYAKGVVAQITLAGLTDVDLDAGDDIYLENIIATDTGKARIIIEYQERFKV